MTKWIKCSERLPDKNISVLIFVPSYKEVHTAEFCDWGTCSDWHISFGKHAFEELSIPQNEVTHWQPLPKIPEGEE